MLDARPNVCVTAWFDWYCRRALRKGFHRVRLFAESPAEWAAFDPRRPRLYVVNHSSFWDGFVMNFVVRRHRPQPLYCMIDEVQVRRHPFFRRVGGFSVDRKNPRRAMKSLDYAAELLRRDPPPAVVVFPQGRIEPNDVRPVRCEGGVARLLRGAPHASVVPVALRYEFCVEQYPEVYVRWGRERAATEFAGRDGRAELEATLTESVEALRGVCFRREPGTPLLCGEPSISEWNAKWRKPGPVRPVTSAAARPSRVPPDTGPETA